MSVTINEVNQTVTIAEDNTTVNVTEQTVDVVEVAGGITGVGVGKLTVSSTQPSNPSVGDLWIVI